MHSLILCTCLASLGQTDERSLVGLWELTYYSGLKGQNELWTNWIIELNMSGDKLDGRVVANSPAHRGSELERVQWENGRLRLKFTPAAEGKKSPHSSGAGIEFDGVLAARPEDGVVGILGADYPARMVRRDSPKVAKDFTGRQYFAPLQKAMDTLKGLRSIATPAALKDKSKREAAVRAGNELLDRTIPHLEEALEHPDSRAQVEAALFLVRQGVARKQPVARLTPWARLGEQAARHYGPRHHAECTAQLAGAIPPTAESAPLILELIRSAEKSLHETHPLDLHCRVLWVKDAALRAAGDTKASAGLNHTWQKLEKRIQDLRRQQGPLPKVAKAEGRPIENERRAVLNTVETPSWDMDTCINPLQAAIDGLAATFGDRVILYEYGWFPRPLPLAANPGAIAFESFHTRLYLAKKSAYPVLLNSQFIFSIKITTEPLPAQKIYDGLFAEAAQALGTAAAVKLCARAERKGDKVEVHTEVKGLPKPGYVSVLLVENWAYYAKPGLMFTQHRVVRATQGDGVGVNGAHRFEFDLAKLERDLSPIVEGVPAWDVVVPSGNVGASRNLVRAARWHEPYVIVKVGIEREVQQAVKVKVSGF